MELVNDYFAGWQAGFRAGLEHEGGSIVVAPAPQRAKRSAWPLYAGWAATVVAIISVLVLAGPAV